MSGFSGEPEQRRLGHNGVDVIDEFCEASIFDEAAKYLTRTNIKLANDQKLRFYALFKQATVGPCNTPKPSLLSMYERTKWNAWNDLGKISKDEAITSYVAELEKVAPSWREEAHNYDSASDSEERGAGDSGGSDAMMNPQSRPIAEDEVPIEQMNEKDKNIWFWAGQDNFEQVKKKVQQGTDVNAKDEEGRTPLHWAVDRAHEQLARDLITQLKADVNAQDHEGSTPLHYAALCEHLPLIRLLLQHGSDPHLADEGGDTPAALLEDIKDLTDDIKQLLQGSKSKKE